MITSNFARYFSDIYAPKMAREPRLDTTRIYHHVQTTLASLSHLTFDTELVSKVCWI